MLTYEEIKQAFDLAIENVGIETFKATSFFATNTTFDAKSVESKAA